MSETLNILLLGGAKRITFVNHLIHAVEKRGKQARLFSYELSDLVPIATLAEICIGKKWKASDVIDDIDRLVKAKGIDIIIPFVDGGIEVASRYAAMNSSCFVPAGVPDVVSQMFDKVKADSLFRSNGFPVPEKFNPDCPVFPAIAKPRTGSASKGIRILYDIKDYCSLKQPDEYIIQEYIADREEYTVDCYTTNSGRFICAVPRLRIEVAGGEVTTTETFRDETVESLSKCILEKLGLRGAVTIQFIHSKKDNRLLLMEINPRVGGGSTCSIASGANLCQFIVDESLGLEVKECDDWKDGIRVVRYSQDVVFDNNGKEVKS